MRHLTASLLAGTAALLAATAPALAKPVTERVSVSSAEEQADNSSFAGVGISSYGRYVVFNSLATNFVAQDQNGAQDVFLRDRRNGTTALVSRSSSGEQGNDLSAGPSVSRDGRFVAFSSRATNLVPGDTNGFIDLFVRDRETKTTVLVSAARGGGPADGGSSGKISGDGRFVAFTSEATNLVRGDTNGPRDVFVRNLTTGVTALVSKSLSGGPADRFSQGVAISVAQYDHSEGLAITGGFVYRGASIPALAGHYLCGDIVNGRVFHVPVWDLVPGRQAELKELTLRRSGREVTLLELAAAVGASRVDLRFGQDVAGEIYVLTKQEGKVRRLRPV